MFWKARLFVPFAGYFLESHPGDSEIRRLNRKNTPEEAQAAVERACPGTQVWLPYPGGTVDVKTGRGDGPAQRVDIAMRQWDFDTYTEAIVASAMYPPLHTMCGVEAYFQWAAMPQYELILHVIEADEALEATRREYYVDFSSVLVMVSTVRPPVANLMRMRVRQDVMMDVMRRGASWDEIYIGFQAFPAAPSLIYRRPNFQPCMLPPRRAILSSPIFSTPSFSTILVSAFQQSHATSEQHVRP